MARDECATASLGSLEQLRLGLSYTFYSVSRALRLHRLRDLLAGASLAPDADLWLLGRRYALEGTDGAVQEEVRRVGGGAPDAAS